MKKQIWYEVNPCSDKLDLNNDNSFPNAYFLDRDDAIKYSELWRSTVEVTKVINPKHLEFLVKKKRKLVGSFYFKSHAQKYFEELSIRESKYKIVRKDFISSNI